MDVSGRSSQTLIFINSSVWRVRKSWLGHLENTLIWQTAQKWDVMKYFLLWNSQRETFNICKANPIIKYFRNNREDKGKPERTSIRYGMILWHHGTRNKHGVSTHPRRVRTDPHLPKCTTSVCAVYKPQPCSYCQLYIPIRTRTPMYSLVSCFSTQVLVQNAWLGT